MGAATNNTQHPEPACIPSFYSSIYVHYRLRQLAFPQYEISTQPPVVAAMFINHAPVQAPSTASVGVMHRQSQRPTGHTTPTASVGVMHRQSQRPAGHNSSAAVSSIKCRGADFQTETYSLRSAVGNQMSIRNDKVIVIYGQIHCTFARIVRSCYKQRCLFTRSTHVCNY